jgi:uncharacterized membrane protein YhdT
LYGGKQSEYQSLSTLLDLFLTLTSSSLDRPFSFYQGLYAGLGISQAVFTFALYVMYFLSALTDAYLIAGALSWILYPGWFPETCITKPYETLFMPLCHFLIQQSVYLRPDINDTLIFVEQPVGRIMGIFGKDIDCKGLLKRRDASF